MGTFLLSNKRFSPAGQSAFDACFGTREIACGPVAFQCVHLTWQQRCHSLLRFAKVAS